MKFFWNMYPATSLRYRLFVYISGGLLALWLFSVTAGSLSSLHEINEAADSQMAQLAQTLMQVSHDNDTVRNIVDIETLLASNHGDAKSNNHGFAVWDKDGTRLIADRHGKDIPFQTASGFSNSGPVWQSGSWRYLYLHDKVDGHTVAVSQRLKERFSTLISALWAQFAVSLLALPALFFLIHYGIRRGLEPLDKLSAELRTRDADSLHAVSEDVPVEALPMVQSLNGLLTRVSAAIGRERRFTSDAAHELRSPLAALKVQAEVFSLSNEREQPYHLAKMHESIARAQRLTEQLLVLSRIDPLSEVPDAEPVNWQQIAHQALKSANLQAREKRVRLQLNSPCGIENVLPLRGNAVLLELMLRNLLDNAVRYSPENSRVSLTLNRDGICMCDEGPGIAPEHMMRICERFYRPAGQTQQGSGLGLSIVESIAALHGLRLDLQNRPEGGLCAGLEKAV
ncbi:ATP-binding protein [Neisseria dentiae]|nr:ATP-binding protein [Neisseria dentiae]STZ50358.1 protein BasS [Neisseria dentiae]